MKSSSSSILTPVLLAGSVIILVSFAIRASFGVFQIPIANEFGWFRTEFSFAIAIQNLFWGIGTPIFGALADKFGDRKAVVAGAICYSAGLILSSYAVTPGQHQLLEILVGFGIAGTGFGVILAVIGRAASEENRSISLGIATAAGSAGQIFGPVAADFLMRFMPWQTVFLIFAGCVAASLAVLPLMRSPHSGSHTDSAETMPATLKRAFADPSYTMIFLGFFSCGYQLAFITAHFPAFITEMCSAIPAGGMLSSLGIATTSALGAVSIALIGLANVGGTILAGWLGQSYSRKYLLAGLYTARTLIAAVFILLPITPASVVVFSIGMGSLWLATVPLTSGLVAQIYGVKFMGTLYGLVFFSHQLGGFLGVWLGGWMYDAFGDYTFVWWVGVLVGAFSAIIHLPVNEEPLAGRSPATGSVVRHGQTI